MTSQLPLQVSCLTLSHVIDDPNVVEGYLAQDPAAANCFPVIIRDLFFMNTENSKYGLPENNHIPNAATTLAYLLALWPEKMIISNRFYAAAENGATYLLPYLAKLEQEYYASLPDARAARWRVQYVGILEQSYSAAARYGHIETMEALERLNGAKFNRMTLIEAIDSAIRGNQINTVLYLLPADLFERALDEAARIDRMAIIDAIIAKYPDELTHGMLAHAISTAAAKMHYEVVIELAKYGLTMDAKLFRFA